MIVSDITVLESNLQNFVFGCTDGVRFFNSFKYFDETYYSIQKIATSKNYMHVESVESFYLDQSSYIERDYQCMDIWAETENRVHMIIQNFNDDDVFYNIFDTYSLSVQ